MPLVPLSIDELPESQDLSIANRAEILSNSRWFDPFLVCTDDFFETQVDILFTELSDWYLSHNGSLKGFRKADNVNMLRKIITNLGFNTILSPRKYISMHFNRGYYSLNNRYQPKFGSCGSAARVRDFLVSRNYIEHHQGFYTQSSGFVTRIKATNALATLFSNLKVYQFYSNQFNETLILRDHNKFNIDYSDDVHPSIPFIRRDLEAINTQIATSWIDLYVTDEIYRQLCDNEVKYLNLTRTKLCRIFNNSSFELGGRFFKVWWQEIPKEYRQFITINSETTVELDYSGMNVALLYAESGLQYPDFDAYQIGGFERKISKLVFNIILNTSSRQNALKAAENSAEIDLSRTEIDELLTSLETLHEPINHTYYTNVASRLQNTESKIANLLLLRFTMENIVVLPIHDGFIVQRQHEQRLRNAMIDCFRTITDGDSRVPEASVEAHLNENIEFDEQFEIYSEYYDRRSYFDSVT